MFVITNMFIIIKQLVGVVLSEVRLGDTVVLQLLLLDPHTS